MRLVNILTGEECFMEFATGIHRPTVDMSEKLDPVPAVTIEPYLPPQYQIADMMDAGVRLALSRKARFDNRELGIDEDSDEVPLDPTREPGVDLVDVVRAAQSVAKELAASKAAAVLKAEEDGNAARKAEIESEVQSRIAAEREKMNEGESAK